MNINNKDEKEIQIINMHSLSLLDLAPVEYLIDGILPAVGLCMIAAPPKYGKSYLVLDLSTCIAQGVPFLGFTTHKAGVLYLALEDSPNRIKERVMQVNGGTYPENVNLLFSVDLLEDDLMKGLLEIMKLIPQTKMIIIDTLQVVRESTKNEASYASDYKEMRIFKQFAEKMGICILLVHHCRKTIDALDPLNSISGTTGIVGAMDAVIVMYRKKRESVDTQMFVTGRDVENQTYQLNFDNGIWKMIGDTNEIEDKKEKENYESNQIISTIKKCLISGDGEWRGSMSDLIGESCRQQNEIKMTPRKLSEELKNLYPQLWHFDDISHNIIGNGTGGGKHVFKQEGN